MVPQVPMTDDKIFNIVLRQPSPQLLDDCTCGPTPFHLYTDFPLIFLVFSIVLVTTPPSARIINYKIFKLLLMIHSAQVYCLSRFTSQIFTVSADVGYGTGLVIKIK
jgi:hypothetical protein